MIDKHFYILYNVVDVRRFSQNGILYENAGLYFLKDGIFCYLLQNSSESMFIFFCFISIDGWT